MSTVAKVRFDRYPDSIATVLDLVDAGSRLPNDGLILIKPNLTNSDKPPVTTDPAAAEALYRYGGERLYLDVLLCSQVGRVRKQDLPRCRRSL